MNTTRITTGLTAPKDGRRTATVPELVPAEPLTPEWHAARRLGVTATDVVTVCGLSRV